MSIEVVQVAAWAQYPWLEHAFSTRLGGVSTVYGGRTLNLGWTTEDDPHAVAENRRMLVTAVDGGLASELVTLRQVHGTEIRVVDASDERQSLDGRALHEGDGLMTSTPGVLLGIQTADCVPVMLVDVVRRAVAVLHGGWRGTAARIVAVGVERMRTEFGSRIEELVAAVGPSIGPCCYVVGDEVRSAFCEGFADGESLFCEDRLNLWEANRRQLVDAGIATDSVTMVGACTACARSVTGERRYFSHRAERGRTGRMMTLAGVRKTT